MAAGGQAGSLSVRYALTAEEFAEARRWIRFFRLGRRGGVVALLILIVLGIVYVAVAAVSLFEPTSPPVAGGRDPVEGYIHGVMFGAMGLVVVVAPLVVMWRAWWVRGKHLVRESPDYLQVELNANGLYVVSINGQRHWSWDQTTWLQGLETVWVLSTWKEHLVIPRRAVAGVEQFEARVWEYLRKQGPQGGFEVLSGPDGLEILPGEKKGVARSGGGDGEGLREWEWSATPQAFAIAHCHGESNGLWAR